MKGITVIVRKVSQLLAGVVFLYGIYIIVHGHLTPGGGFAGGAVISGAFVLVILSFGSEIQKLNKSETRSSLLESTGILLFLLIAAAGFFLGSAFFFNFLPKGTVGKLLSAGFIPLFNIAVGIEVAAGLLTIFLALLIYKDEEDR